MEKEKTERELKELLGNVKIRSKQRQRMPNN